MENNYTVKRKGEDGKYFSYGNVKKNQFGNYSLGLKVTPELKALVQLAEIKSWLNFSMFDEKPKEQKPSDPQEPPPYDDGSEIPF